MISIIIPVYNVEKYIDQCVQSVIKQTYTNWECILVNDGSTDHSGQLCEQWRQRDQRIVCIHQKNQGVSMARNIGLEKAKGAFITFIDSDDWVDNNYLENLIGESSVKGNDFPDLVVTGIRQHDDGGMVRITAPQNKAFIRPTSVNTQLFIDNIGLHYGPMSKLYKSFIIKQYQIRFPANCSLGEDLIFNFTYLTYIKNILYLPTTSYNYFIRKSGLCNKQRPDVFDIHYTQWHIQKLFLERKGMWNSISKEKLYLQLWGYVYEGIFMVPPVNLKRIKKTLSIKEIKDLRETSCLFQASKWLTFCILNRMYLLLFLYLRLIHLTK